MVFEALTSGPARGAAFVRRGEAVLRRMSLTHSAGWRVGAALIAVVIVTAAMTAIRKQLDVLDVALLYLLLCLAVGVVAGSWPAVVVAVLSFLAFNYFFLPPLHTFTIDREYHEVALVAYLVAALVTGQLVARARDRTDAAERAQRRTALLYELNAALVGNVRLDALLDEIVERVVGIYGAEQCRILRPDEQGNLRVVARFPPNAPAELDRSSQAVATWAIEHRLPAGRSAPNRLFRPPPGGAAVGPTIGPFRPLHTLYVPIATADRTIGVLETVGKRGGGRFGTDDEQLLASFADQAALALERSRLSDDAARSVALARSDELKSALLAAVSHDLRTPLATIKASVTSLLDASVAWDDAARTEFLQAIDEETDRLDLLVGNLLDLSKIEGGALRPDRAWYDVAELVADIRNRVVSQMGEHLVEIDVEPGLPLAHFDYVQLRQVLLNLVENARKYSPSGTTIELSAQRVDRAIELAVRDHGRGIEPSALPHIFDRFYRADGSGRVPGSGLGLAISKGLVEAHGGRIWAESVAGTGTTVRFTIPLAETDEPVR